MDNTTMDRIQCIRCLLHFFDTLPGWKGHPKICIRCESEMIFEEDFFDMPAAPNPNELIPKKD